MDGVGAERDLLDLDYLFEFYDTLAEAEATVIVRLADGWSLLHAVCDHGRLCVRFRHGWGVSV